MFRRNYSIIFICLMTLVLLSLNVIAKKTKTEVLDPLLTNEKICRYISQVNPDDPEIKIYGNIGGEEVRTLAKECGGTQKEGFFQKKMEQLCSKGNATGCHILGKVYSTGLGISARYWDEKSLDYCAKAIVYEERSCSLGYWNGCYSASFSYQGLSCYFAEKSITAPPGESYTLQKQQNEALGIAIAFAAKGCDLQRTAGLPPQASACMLQEQILRIGASCRFE